VSSDRPTGNRGPAPFDTTGVAASVLRRQACGHSVAWAIHATPAGTYRVSRWDTDDHDQWAAMPTGVSCDSWIAALTSDISLLLLQPNEVSEINVGDRALARTLLAALRVEGTDSPEDLEWGDLDVDEWSDDDGEIGGSFDGPAYISRWASLNGDRLVTLRDATSGQLVTFGWTGDAEPVGNEVASYHWGSEAGMTSGAGAIHLTELHSGHALLWGSGDDAEMSVELVPLSPGPLQQATDIADWLDKAEYNRLGPVNAAALTLEPLDPAGALPPEVRAEWDASLNYSGFGEEFRVDLSVDDQTARELRRILTERSASYRAISEGLADPSSEMGRALRAALVEGDVRVDI
jgi:hypothetical protein